MRSGFSVSRVDGGGGGASCAEVAERPGAGASSAFPCLYSNNSNEGGLPAWRILSRGHKRMAHVLATEIILLAKRFGIAKVGLLTLTFAEHITRIKEAQRRFNSLNTGILRDRYERAIASVERQESGRLHFHVAVVLRADIRTGADFEAFERQDYRSGNQVLRSEWAFWRKTAPAYGFGRTELLPVKSTAEAIGRYLGKYISKHIRHREQRDVGARLVRFSGYGPGERSCSSVFAWNTDNGWLWRHKVKAFCRSRGLTFEELCRVPRWAWRLKDQILSMRVDEVFPSEAAAHQSLAWQEARWIAEAKAIKILDGMRFTKTYELKKV